MIQRNLKYLYPFIIAILIFMIAFNSCDSKPIEIHNNEPIKKKVIEFTKKKDSTDAEVKKTDVVRLKYIVKWRTKIKDTTIYKPCEELILICDTIIHTDSTEISQLRQVINYSDSIIVNQKVMLYNDSLDILALKKYGKKQRRQKNLALIGLGIISGLLIIK